MAGRLAALFRCLPPPYGGGRQREAFRRGQPRRRGERRKSSRGGLLGPRHVSVEERVEVFAAEQPLTVRGAEAGDHAAVAPPAEKVRAHTEKAGGLADPEERLRRGRGHVQEIRLFLERWQVPTR